MQGRENLPCIITLVSKSLFIKICGITSSRDAEMLSKFLIHAIGLNFIKRSKRKITKTIAEKILKKLPVSIEPILILEDENIENVLALCKSLKLNTVQLHGLESIEYCKELKNKKKDIKIIKALKAEKETLSSMKSYEKVCDFILLDSSNHKKQMGGTGKTVNWGIAKEIVKKSKLPVILAGGLNPKNIKEAIKKVKPYGLDINSGVELSPGKKDEKLIETLFKGLSKK